MTILEKLGLELPAQLRASTILATAR
jgi:hypothetical protein